MRNITIDGVTKPLAQWCQEKGTNYQTALSRLSRGWSPERAVEPPKGSKISRAAKKEGVHYMTMYMRAKREKKKIESRMPTRDPRTRLLVKELKQEFPETIPLLKKYFPDTDQL